MPTPLSDLFHIISLDHELGLEVKQAVEWLASKPEGLEMLKKGVALHGGPVLYIVHPSMEAINGTMNHDMPEALKALIPEDRMAVHIAIPRNPGHKNIQLIGQKGEKIAVSLKRTIAHETTHVAQPGVSEVAKKLHARQLAIANACIDAEVPWQDYAHRSQALKRDAKQVRKLFGEVHDRYIAPNRDRIHANYKQGLAADPDFQAYVRDVEEPAIAFENHMMSKYEKEPPRTLDYINSADQAPSIEAVNNREFFVEQNMAAYKTALAAADQKSAIRPDWNRRISRRADHAQTTKTNGLEF